MSLQGASRVTVLGFASVVVLIVLGINIAFDAVKKRARVLPEDNFDAPTFAVPQIPGTQPAQLGEPRV